MITSSFSWKTSSAYLYYFAKLSERFPDGSIWNLQTFSINLNIWVKLGLLVGGYSSGQLYKRFIAFFFFTEIVTYPSFLYHMKRDKLSERNTRLHNLKLEHKNDDDNLPQYEFLHYTSNTFEKIIIVVCLSTLFWKNATFGIKILIYWCSIALDILQERNVQPIYLLYATFPSAQFT